MSNPEEGTKYQVKNEQSVQGQVIGDHATVHQYFHPPVDSTDLFASPSGDVIVLTALPEEFRAVVAHLQGTQEVVHPETGTIYRQGSFPGKQGTWRVAVAQIGMGGLSAASETERASNLFHPRLMFFVGIAGGLKDVRHGDVVVATKVYAYESGKAAARFKPRPEVWHASHALEQRARAEANDDAWLARLDGQHTDPMPCILFGPLAAGEKVLADQRSSVYRFLQANYGDSLAVEMEGHGFLQAVHANQYIYALVIRGISDLINDKLAADAAGMQEKAARHAAAFAFQMLANLTLPSGNASVLEQKPLPGEFSAESEAHQKPTDLTFPEGSSQTLVHGLPKVTEEGKHHSGGSTHKLKNLRKRRLLVSLAILLALGLSLVSFLPFRVCSFAFCHPSQQPIKQPSPLSGGEVQDQNLSVELIDVVSPSFVFLDDPNYYSASNTLPRSISAVLLAKNTTSYCNIIIAVQNLRFGGVDILIDDLALKLQHIPITPRPLRVWTPGVSTTYNAYPYPVTYQGQSLDELPNQLLYAVPPQNVILQPARNNHAGESNQLSIQVMSTVTAYLQFQIQVSYQIANAARVYTLILSQTFQVVFSDASNWQEYILKNGSLVRDP